MSAEVIFPPNAVEHVTFSEHDVGVSLELATQMRGERVRLAAHTAEELLELLTRCVNAVEPAPKVTPA